MAELEERVRIGKRIYTVDLFAEPLVRRMCEAILDDDMYVKVETHVHMADSTRRILITIMKGLNKGKMLGITIPNDARISPQEFVDSMLPDLESKLLLLK